MRDEVAAVVPATRADDVVGHARARPRRRRPRPARREPASRASTVGGCTRESPDLYSYRRDGARPSGRQAGLIRMASA